MELTYKLSDDDWTRMTTAIGIMHGKGSQLDHSTPDVFAREWILQNALDAVRRYEERQATMAALGALPAPVAVPVVITHKKDSE